MAHLTTFFTLAQLTTFFTLTDITDQNPIFSASAAGTGNTEDVRVYVRCNYCDTFRSTLNSDTWEAILNHILPVAKEEIQTTFYGDLEKHFHRSVRLQVNGRWVILMNTVNPQILGSLKR